MAGEFYERLSDQDHSLLVSEGAATHMHVAAVLMLDEKPLTRSDGGIDIARVRTHVASRLYLLPRYRQRLAYVPLENYPVWIDDAHFHLAYHVRHTSLPRPGDEAQLKRLVGRIMSQQLDRTKPLWELWVVEGLAGGRAALVSKTHHALIDGLAGVDLLSLLLDTSPDREAAEVPPFAPRPAPSRTRLLRNELLRRLGLPLDLARSLPGAARNPATLVGALGTRVASLADMLSVGPRGISDNPFNRATGPHRRFDWVTMDLADVRAARQRLDATLFDLVLAVVAGAVRLFLEKRRVEIEPLDFRVVTPVSTGSGEEREARGNQVSPWLIELPIAEPDPLERLRLIRSFTRRLMDTDRPLAARTLTQRNEFMASTLLSLGAQAVPRTRPFNLVVTNIPGPQVPLYLLGAQVQNGYPVVPLGEQQGLAVGLFSYDGRLCWGFNADWDVVPDLALFADAIVTSFNEFRGLTR